MDQYTQANRLISIETPLGADKLLLTSFNGEESISKPFEFQKRVTAENFNEIRPEDAKDLEQTFIHAEKNLDTEVENDETYTVAHDRTKITGKHAPLAA